MGLVKLTAGDGYTYLTRQVAAHDATDRGHHSLGDYYSERGESPGRWAGAGLAALGLPVGSVVTEAQLKALFGEGRHPLADELERAVLARGGSAAEALAAGALGSAFRIYRGATELQREVAEAFSDFNRERGLHWRTAVPAEDRARIRTVIAQRLFPEQHQRPPRDQRELAGFLAKLGRQATTAVAGFDLTFSPVKSVSTLWALASPEVADQVRAAHEAAVVATLNWLEREALFTRLGNGGVRQVPVRGMVAATFTHRDSRAGDPDLHTHVAVANKVQTLDGRWLAVDARVLYRAKVAASEHYNTRLEAELVSRLGVRFTPRESTGGKRPVREVEGVNPELIRHWSRRRHAIELRRSQLAARFQADHGRPPTAIESLSLAQQATLETRDAKHSPRSEQEQRVAWAREAEAVLGGPAAIDGMVSATLGRATAHTALAADELQKVARSVVAAVSARRATWGMWHLHAEASRQLRGRVLTAAALDQLTREVTVMALEVESVRLDPTDPISEPAALRRPDGESVYAVHGGAMHTSADILAAEERILAAATRRDGRTVSEVRVGIAVAEEAANGVTLNAAQAAMVRTLATSGARVQLALAPAGTGKTTAMRVLARAWSDSDGWVLGLAPSAAAAHELRTAIGSPTDTLAKLTHALREQHPNHWPGWMHRIGPRTLVILDEAGQAGTVELAEAVDFILARGASLRLIGDDQQLAAVAAGGVLRDLARTHGGATLTEVRRFEDPAEAAATLAIREGSPAALGFYADHRRIHVGDPGTVTDQAYAAWAADRRAGKDSLLLAPTRDQVTALNARARAERLTHTGPPGLEVDLADGTRASAGDLVVSRRNERRIPLGPTDWVKNGDRWVVEEVLPTGEMRVRHMAHRRVVRLPAAYVREQLTLGYAATIHSAQGQTTDTTHAVISGAESRQLLYVALSRGRTANHLYLTTVGEGDPHEAIHRDTLLPPTAIDVLTAVVERDGSQHSATSTRHELASATALLHDAVLRYQDALGVAAEATLGPDTLTRLDTQAEKLLPNLTSSAAYPTLRANLALHALHGADPVTVLTEALDSRDLTSAQDPAAVLIWRLPQLEGSRPLPWLPGLPSRLAEHGDWRRDWGDYLNARADRVRSLAGQVAHDAQRWTPASAPAWARDLLEPELSTLRGDVAVWRAAFAVPDADETSTGPHQLGGAAERHQRDLRRRLRNASPHDTAAPSWRDALPEEVTGNPRRGALMRHLEALGRAGLDVPALVRDALSQGPLPTEVPADALWWRVVRHLGPAVLEVPDTAHQSLRPPWLPSLTEVLGHNAAGRIVEDPGWPALVAAVDAASRMAEGWSPESLLRTVADGLDSHRVGAAGLCHALTWRIAALCDPPEDPELLPPEPEDDLPEPQVIGTGLDAVVPEATGTSPARIREVNALAMDFFEARHHRSWTPAYVAARLGVEMPKGHRVGYAPPGPRSLLHFLSDRGASTEELVDAGLVKHTEQGDERDVFRDRLMLPIVDEHGIAGFQGRRNPTKDHRDDAGPKYLNTRTTTTFTKGDCVFGLAESRDLLVSGATPVLVEGPFDALAVTLAGAGRYVGVAPLGTALTSRQISLLAPGASAERRRVIVATDADRAGWEAAQRAYWRLCATGPEPDHLALPAGEDPAAVLTSRGADALLDALTTATPMATAMLDRILHDSDDLATPAGRLRVVRDTARIIASAPPEQWPAHLAAVTKRAGLPPGMLHLEVLDAGAAWTDDPHAQADARIEEARLRARRPLLSERAATAQSPSTWVHGGALPETPSLRGGPVEAQRSRVR